MNIAKYEDGTYRIESGSIQGEFVVSNGHIVKISECLRKVFYLLVKQAVKIEPLADANKR
jgi:hypothetical protein